MTKIERLLRKHESIQSRNEGVLGLLLGTIAVDAIPKLLYSALMAVGFFSIVKMFRSNKSKQEVLEKEIELLKTGTQTEQTTAKLKSLKTDLNKLKDEAEKLEKNAKDKKAEADRIVAEKSKGK